MERSWDEADKFLGLTLSEVQIICDNYRVISEDGEYCLVTMDLDQNRINLGFDFGVVTNAYWG